MRDATQSEARELGLTLPVHSFDSPQQGRHEKKTGFRSGDPSPKDESGLGEHQSESNEVDDCRP